ncbi:MAG: UDP-N-acetylglucosamine 2-epimerase (non-hydrolyzing) [Verrucomicrobia bacterium]|nr:UDP-N-acetylglucosamine 2-epimerase (non-hydrolyzing) [Verrucomicrobiota bacterium]
MSKKKILCVVGTRPEAIKMAPVILELTRRSDVFDTHVMATAQHREMLDQALGIFSITPDTDLDLMEKNQTLTHITCKALSSLSTYLQENPTDAVLAQGDTTTVMATAMACFYTRTKFAHVEAGLRTGNMYAPYPEEFNRRVAALAGQYHLAPTNSSARNLIDEGIDESTVYVTGNSVVDALFYVLKHTQEPSIPVPEGHPFVLMTCHRRENFGAKVREIFETVRDFASDRPHLFFWYPVHPNPNVLEPAHEILGKLNNVILTEPIDYVTCIHAMKQCALVLSDSGGVQEEAPSLGKPVLVLRDVTERPEGVAAGTCLLVGPHRANIEEHLTRLLDNPDEYKRVSQARNPYGDGRTAERIAAVLETGSCEQWDG